MLQPLRGLELQVIRSSHTDHTELHFSIFFLSCFLPCDVKGGFARFRFGAVGFASWSLNEFAGSSKTELRRRAARLMLQQRIALTSSKIMYFVYSLHGL